MRTRENLAWAAGLFEGEGCINGYVSKDGMRGIQLSLNMRDFDAVVQFRDVIGFGHLYEKPPGKPHWSPQLQWHVGTFEHAQAVIAMLWPWLCARRRATAARVLGAYRAAVTKRDQSRVRRGAIADALRRGGLTQRAIARQFGVSEPTVSRVRSQL